MDFDQTAFDEANERAMNAPNLHASRHGVSFIMCLMYCARNPTFVAEFDRLQGSNLSFAGSPMDLAIDEASGRQKAEVAEFVQFVWETVFLRFGPTG